MTELREGADWPALYGPLILIVGQEGDQISITLHDSRKGALKGRIPAGHADTIAEAKEKALAAAARYLGGRTPAKKPEWPLSRRWHWMG